MADEMILVNTTIRPHIHGSFGPATLVGKRIIALKYSRDIDFIPYAKSDSDAEEWEFIRSDRCDYCDGENRHGRENLLYHVVLRLRLEGVEKMGWMW